MMRKLFTGIALISALSANAQVIEKWAARYTFADTAVAWKDNDEASAVAIDEQNNVYVTGSSMRDGGDIVTIKYNGAGTEQWKAIYNGPANGNDGGTALVVDAAGNVYVCGISLGSGTASSDFITIKYNSSGVKQWDARYVGPENRIDIATQIAIDKQGNVYVAGRSEKDGQSFDIVLVKYNNAGVEQWVNRYNGPGNYDEYSNGLIVDDNGNAYIAGETREKVGQDFDFVTLKYNTSGVLSWAKVANGIGRRDDRAKGLALDTKGNVITTGISAIDSNASYLTDFLTIKYDPSGTELWRKNFNGLASNTDGAIAVKTDAADHIYVGGNTYTSTGNNDYGVVKYNDNGVKIWAVTFSGMNVTDIFKAMTIDASANIYITGQGGGGGTSGKDFLTIKYDSSGLQKWNKSYNGTGNKEDNPFAIAVNSKGVAVVAGGSQGVKSAEDYATVMYADSLLSTAINNKIPSLNANELLVYPNPFNGTATIDYTIAQQGIVSVKIFNSLGQQVANLVNGEMQEGKYSVALDGTQLQDGIYFCEFRASTQISTSKLILQK